jgi:hypothetical protein
VEDLAEAHLKALDYLEKGIKAKIKRKKQWKCLHSFSLHSFSLGV